MRILLDGYLTGGCSNTMYVPEKHCYFNLLQTYSLLDGYLMETQSETGLWGKDNEN